MKPHAKHPEAGVTLIEILVAVTLLSFLSVGMLIAMRVGFNTMGKVDSRLITDRRVSYARRIIESEIAGFVFTTADWHPGQPDYQTLPFTQWEYQTMRFVTTYSLQDAWRGKPQIAALQVIPGADGNGVRLIVNETPYTGGAQAGQMIYGIAPGTFGFAPVVAGPQSFVLADRLAYCHFSYLEPLFEPPFQDWRPDWIMPNRLPQGIRIEMAPLGGSPADLHVSTITTSLNVDQTPGRTYADNY
jgi:hypothetical protein